MDQKKTEIFAILKRRIKLFLKRVSIYKRPNSGSSLILLLFFALPVLLFGTKYVLDMRTLYKVKIGNSDAEADRKTAKAAALELAQNWNPGLTFKQQEAAAFKIVDAVYRNYISITNLAIPGLDTYRYKKVNKNYGEFAPLEVKQELISPQRNFVHTKKKKYITDYRFSPKSSWNSNYMLWKSIDNATNPKYRQSCFDEVNEKGLERGEYFLDHHDISISPMVFQDSLLLTTPNLDNNYLTYLRDLGSESNPAHTGSHTEYYKDPTMAITTSIGVDKDSIAVTLGSNDTGYAIPAECNVDIVLAIPVNGAASNRYNEDAASDNPGTPVNSVNQIEKTPIYEMGQACKAFVKDNFYHTRGVNMGLIPYSAKVSVAPDKWNSYTSEIPKFSDSYFQNNPTSTKKMIGAVLYGSYGQKNKKLSTAYDGNNALMSYPIMCRRGETFTAANSKYGTNEIAKGILLSNADPSSDTRLRYRRMKLNPCYSGYANMLSLRCDKTCETYNPNPYYMIEPTADMVKIYEMCNALFPIYDLRNVSNFLFIPIEWANNFFQDWTRDPSETENVATDKLSLQSKKKQGRKKVLILLVNKPDWFEPGELTYLGFDNDYSDVSTYESDKIDFSINYSDTSKRFLDADKTRFDGTIAGTKRLLIYKTTEGTVSFNSSTGIRQCTESAKGRLTFPNKGTVILKVIKVPAVSGQLSDLTSGKVSWGYYPQALNVEGNVSSRWSRDPGFPFTMRYGNNRFVVISMDGFAAYSTDGITWHKGTRRINPDNTIGWSSMAWTGEHFVATTNIRGYVVSSRDGETWEHHVRAGGMTTSYYDDDISWDGTRLFATVDYGPIYVTTVKDGSSGWTTYGGRTSSSRGFITDYEQFKYGGGYYVRKGYSNSNQLEYSTNMTSGYTRKTLPLARCSALNYGPGYWAILTQYGDLMCSTNASASSWSIIDGSSSNTTSSSLYKLTGKNDWVGICYGNDRWVAYTRAGDVAVSNVSSFLKFINISGNTEKHTLTSDKEETFVIGADQINNSSGGSYYIDFEMRGIRLISAEITNRPYEKITPKCSLKSGENQNTVYVETNVIEPITIKAKFSPNGSSVSNSSVTFNSNGGVSQNVTTHPLIRREKFTFDGGSLSSSGYSKGPNFGNNYSIKKINYSLNNAKIVKASIAPGKQILRWNSSGKDPGLAVYATTSEQSSYNSSYYNYWTIVVMNLSDIYARWYTTPRTWTTTEYYDCDPYTEYYDCNPYTEYYDCNCYNYSCNCGYHDCDCRNESYTYECGSSDYYVSVPALSCSGRNYCEHDGKYGSISVGGVTVKYNYAFRCPCDSTSMTFNFAVTDSPYPTAIYVRDSYYTSGTAYLSRSSYSSSLSSSGSMYDGCYWIDSARASSGLLKIKLTKPSYCSGTRRVCSSCYSCSTCRSCSRCSRTRYRTCSRTVYRRCSRQVGHSGTGNMYYSALNTANARRGTDVYGYSIIPWTSSSTPSRYRSSVPNTQPYANYKEAEGQSAVFYKVNPTGDYLNYFYATNNGKEITWEADQTDEWVNNNQGITAKDNWIKFNGDATIEVEVEPLDDGSGIIYERPSGEEVTYPIFEDDYQIVTITPQTHRYEETSDGEGYRIKLKLRNVKLDSSYGAKFLRPLEDVYRNKRIDKSGNNRRYIEYANFNGVPSRANNISGSFSTYWDYLHGTQSIASNDRNQISNITPLEFGGDIVHEMEDSGSKPAYANLTLGDNGGYHYVPGTVRLFVPIWRETINKFFGITEMSGSDSTKSGGVLNLLTTDITYPVNSVLLEGGYQTVSNGVPQETPTQAAMKVTALACAKLKQDYGNNLQIHIVKYRKQQMYKDFSQNNKYHNYSVIDSCATPGAYVVDATSEDQLKAALRVIAEDIKEFAGYKTAQNVDV